MIEMVPVLLLLGLAGVGYYCARGSLSELARAIDESRQNGASSTAYTRAILNAPLAKTDSLEGAPLNEVLERLKRYGEEVKPDWIFGVHPGGRLVSVWLADALNLDPDRCLYIRSDRELVDGLRIEPDSNEPMSGKALVIDDISRTGATLTIVRAFLESTIFKHRCRFTKVNFATLASVLPTDIGQRTFFADWIGVKTTHHYFSLPWSEFGGDISHAYRAMRMEKPYDHELIEKYERLKVDFEFALQLVRTHLLRSFPRVRIP